ncbi:hypothetical protein CPC08DRAFT_823044 [Agrocybe pediades]|nr:hypothetical protein CPC08DRAFT_823044 [Agrocybe pediades]
MFSISSVSTMIELWLHAIYLITMISAIRSLLPVPGMPSSKKSTRVRGITSAVCVFLYINCTLNLALGLVALVQRSVDTSAPEAMSATGNQWLYVAQTFNVTIQSLVADMFLMYRCWIVYAKSWTVIIFPTAFWLRGMALSLYILIVPLIQPGGDVEHAGTSSLHTFLAAKCATTIAVNIYATGFILRKIINTDFTVARRIQVANLAITSPAAKHQVISGSIREKSRTALQNTALMILFEAALPYTLVSIANFIGVILGSNFAYITSAIEIVIIGLTFNQIITRVYKRRLSRDQSSSNLPVPEPLRFSPPTSPSYVEGASHRQEECGKQYVVYAEAHIAMHPILSLLIF